MQNSIRHSLSAAIVCALIASLTCRSDAAELPYSSFRKLSDRQLQRTQLELEFCGNQTASVPGFVVGVGPATTGVEADSAGLNSPTDVTITPLAMRRLLVALASDSTAQARLKGWIESAEICAH